MSVWRRSSALLQRKLIADGSRSFPGVLASTRLIHSSVLDPHGGQSPPYKTINGFVNHHVPKEDSDRTVFLRNLPTFAIEDDIREWFEESNLAVYV